MDDRFNNLTQSLFQKSLDNSSIEEIQSFTKQYPYFAPAQFLLLKRLNPASEEYKSQYQKALLFHYDPLSIGQLIHSQADQEEMLIPEPEFIRPSSEEAQAEVQTPVPAMPEVSGAEPLPATSDVVPVAPDVPLPEAPLEGPLMETFETEEPVPAEPEAEWKEAELKKEVEIKAPLSSGPVSELTFEPFHTVDYFASQGIKLSQEEAPKDQLGKQLKSFTEWLKTMKRLPATDLNKSVDVVAEQNVEHLAEDSVQNSEVVTEAMAEVWMHQGNYQKAIEIYNKLSLLNPSKRAYFASKIDSLKKSF